MIELLLLRDVHPLGETGEVVRVRSGYARNYLLPYGLAREATPALKAEADARRAKTEAERTAKRKTLEALAQRISGLSLTLSAKAGEKKVLFGSIGAPEIVAGLKAQGIEIAPNAIVLAEPFKEVGVFTVPVRLAVGIEATLKVWIVEEGARGG
ncbi:MAG: 50S ribosomal protein L9 [Planctomycetota bacterium]